MQTDNLIAFLGWALTYSWLSVNLTFFGSIANTIVSHNESIRTKAIKEYNEANKSEDESEDESEVEGENV